MALIVGASTKPPARAGHRGCCSGSTSWQGILTAQGTDGAPHSLHADGDQLTLGESNWATVFTLAVVGPGIVTLKEDGLGLRATDGTLFFDPDQADSFGVEDADCGRVRLRTAEGSYLLASGPGEPVTLTPDAAHATAFTLETRVRFGMEWAADEGFPFDETRSTHLWIYNRAVEWILGNKSLGSGPNMTATYNEHERAVLRTILANSAFATALMQGIYDADNTGMFNPSTSGFVFSAHFWHPVANVGGWWDTLPSPRDRPEPLPRNAFAFGTDYFRQSLDESDLVQSGRKLGLAIHYLEDVTQPMHTGLYPNIPGYGAALAMAPLTIGAPEALPNLFGPIITANCRHANYEEWAERAQKDWKISADEINAYDIKILRGGEIDQVHPGGDYWRQAATQSLICYRSWVGNAKSPIAAGTPTKEGQIPDFADAEWGPDGGDMVKLAQRLVINLLLTWVSAAKAAAPLLQAPDGHDISLMSHEAGSEAVIMAARDGQRADVVYLSDPGFEDSRFWALDLVRDANGQPATDSAWTPHYIYRLRNRQNARCIVAGDTYDGNVYLQDPAGSDGRDRPNAHWVFIPGGIQIRAADGIAHRCYTIHDVKHGKWLCRDPQRPDGIGALHHGDQATLFMLVPRP